MEKMHDKKATFYIITILTLCNMFNYIDRNIFNALSPVIKTTFSFSHLQIGLLASAFTVIYVIACPLAGLLGDKYPRPRLLSIAVFFWSLATALAGFARGFWSMAAARISVGVGESAYSSIGPSIVEDYTPKAWKSRAMAIFLVAIPVGSAIGYLLAGYLNEAIGWRNVFFVIGAPGLLLALLSFFVKEPVRDLGRNKDTFFLELKNNTRDVLRNATYMHAVIGYTAFTFVVGGFAVWMPEIMVTAKGISLKDGNIIFGGITVVSGIIGTVLGAYLSDKFISKTSRSPIVICFISILLATPFAALALYAKDNTIFFVSLFISEVFLFMNTSPINIVILESVPADQRSFAMGLSVLGIHAFGDAISPPLIGWVADLTNISTASMLMPIVLVVGFVFWYLCYKSQREDIVSQVGRAGNHRAK